MIMNNSKRLPLCIIGSGLTGVSVAKGLEKSRKPVLMLDVGLDYSESVRRNITKCNNTPAWMWSEEDRKKISSGVESSISGVKEKLLFGSNFATRPISSFPIRKKNARFYTSFAEGGLSNIWGAGLLPMHEQDIKDWPFDLALLEPHYEKVLQFMPMAGQHDPLEQLLPLHCNPCGHSLSRQTTLMLARMYKNHDVLKQRGIYFGASRLAAKYFGQQNRMDCQYCGMCMYGCPYGILYSAKSTLDELRRDEKFTYRSGFVVTQIKEENGMVRIYGTDIKGNAQEPVNADRVILASGAPATAKIILHSLGLYNKPVKLKTSDQYYLPLLSFAGQPDIEHEQLHTMCQSFWVIKKPQISPYLIHCSVFTYNDLYAKAIQALLGKMHSPLKNVTQIPLRRFYFMICYLHSKHSGYLTVSLNDDKQKNLNVEGHKNKDSKQVFRKTRRHIRNASGLTGLHPVPFYRGEKLPGGGNHFGGSFPMSKNPAGLQTDIFGRIKGLDKVHIADSSIFPSITATTISLSVMANAHRIASNIGLE